MQDSFSTIFKSYCTLQAESYEFIARGLGTHKWLEEACRLAREKPWLGPEELCEAWRPALERIYEQVFSPLLRPHRAMMLCFPAPMRLDGGLPWGKMPDLSGDMLKSWEETVNQFLTSMGESQATLPKGLIIGLRELVSTYPRAFELARKYEEMLQDTWEESTKSFALEIKRNGRSSDFPSFFEIYRRVLAEGFAGLLKRKEFAQVQTALIEAVSDFIVAMRKVTEAQMAMFPALPFVTATEMNAVAKNVHACKKRIDGWERKFREGNGHGLEKIAALEERISNLEAQVGAPGNGMAGRKRAAWQTGNGKRYADAKVSALEVTRAT